MATRGWILQGRYLHFCFVACSGIWWRKFGSMLRSSSIEGRLVAIRLLHCVTSSGYCIVWRHPAIAYVSIVDYSWPISYYTQSCPLHDLAYVPCVVATNCKQSWECNSEVLQTCEAGISFNHLYSQVHLEIEICFIPCNWIWPQRFIPCNWTWPQRFIPCNWTWPQRFGLSAFPFLGVFYGMWAL